MTKRLELIWPHKGEHVLQNPETEKWEFCGSKALLPRPLIEIETLGDEKNQQFDPNKSNLLIRGENLFALQSLLPYYAGKIKFVYIDPPFNTGQDFEAYDDNFEHSIWLSMIKERIDLAYEFLHPSGAIAIEIDDTEQAYLKAILDAKFTRNNFITTISVKRSAATGHKAINPGVVNVTEYIHLYAKDKKEWTYKRLFVARDKYDKAYNQYIPNIDSAYSEWKFKPLTEIYAESLNFPDAKRASKELGPAVFKKGMEKFAIEHADHVIRFAIPDYNGVGAEARRFIDMSLADRDTIFCHHREDYDDMYFRNGQRILFLANKTSSENGETQLVEPLTNFWSDISWQGIAKEGGVTLKKGKKPEKLLHRLIDLNTTDDNNDIVLDFFAGSGTTGAVAHRMHRRWIMVEIKDDQVTLALERLKRVVNGEDLWGIIDLPRVRKNGGGFRFLEVGAPLLTEDSETKLTIMNPKYTNGPLTRAVCAIEGFLLTGDEFLHGRNGEHYAHITEKFVDDAMVKGLKRKLKDSQFLTIYAAKGVRRGLQLPNNIQVNRIDSDLIKKYVKRD
ncbi:MAG: site-specific DNA-methyltransferase [Candidatus Altiarchaeota archaeon]|nr:site-specific DNA-methyltransferase [Candidatus Altiarchaeota archaeon]